MKKLCIQDLLRGQYSLSKVKEKWAKIYDANCMCIKKSLDKSRESADNWNEGM